MVSVLHSAQWTEEQGGMLGFSSDSGTMEEKCAEDAAASGTTTAIH